MNALHPQGRGSSAWRRNFLTRCGGLPTLHTITFCPLRVTNSSTFLYSDSFREGKLLRTRLWNIKFYEYQSIVTSQWRIVALDCHYDCWSSWTINCVAFLCRTRAWFHLYLINPLRFRHRFAISPLLPLFYGFFVNVMILYQIYWNASLWVFKGLTSTWFAHSYSIIPSLVQSGLEVCWQWSRNDSYRLLG